MPDRKEKKRKDYVFRRQLIEKPSIIPGCAFIVSDTALLACSTRKAVSGMI